MSDENNIKPKRSRNILVRLYLNEEENKKIERKMQATGTTNFSRYARKMLLDGYIIKRDYDELRKLTNELGYLSRSINQIVKRANTTNSIYEEDLIDLKNHYDKAETLLRKELIKKIRSF